MPPAPALAPIPPPPARSSENIESGSRGCKVTISGGGPPRPTGELREDSIRKTPVKFQDAAELSDASNPSMRNAEVTKASSPDKKRKKALLRRATNEDEVPVFTHPCHPDIIKELLYEMCSDWFIMGSPEAGVGVLGALGLKKPCLVFLSNEAHEKVFRKLVHEAVVKSALGGGDFSNRALQENWARFSKAGTSTSESDGTTSEEEGSGEEEEKKKEKKKKEKKKKKAEENKKKKTKKDKHKKKETKEDKEKKGQKRKQEPKDPGSANVLKKLLAERAGKDVPKLD